MGRVEGEKRSLCCIYKEYVLDTTSRWSGSRVHLLTNLQIPAHCRWQELKDFVRQSALHIRQAVVYDDQHGYPTGIGQIIVKNEDEAWRTYGPLT